MRGAFEVVASFAASHDSPRWLLLASAGVDVVLGVLFVTNPGRSAVAIVWVLGLTAVAWGVAFVATGFVVRRSEHGAAAAPPVAGAPA